jgi:hypothetical protein
MTNVRAPQKPGDSRQVVRSFNADGSANFAQVGVEEIAYKGRFGALATSTTEHDISIGEKYFTIDIDEGLFRTGDDILITSLIDPQCYMWGEIIDTDTTAEPLRLRVFVDDLSNLTGTFAVWELQVVARPKPGIEKDTSTSSVDPTGDGPFTFTVTAGKFFPIGGQLLLKPTTDRSIALLGRVLAYEGTSLVVAKNETNATVSTSYDSWSIALLDAPPADLPPLGIVGLDYTADYSTGILTVNAGSVMDSTGTVLLTLDENITKDLSLDWTAGDAGGAVQRVLLGGTITATTSSVTGSGTAFTTDLVAGSAFSRTGTGANGGSVSIISSDTVMAATAIGGSGVAYMRGALDSRWSATASFLLLICIIRKDDDGSIDISLSSLTPSGKPDLPDGHSLYRTIGHILIDYGLGRYSYNKYLYDSGFPFAFKTANYVLHTEKTDFTWPGNNAKLLGSSSTVEVTVGGQITHSVIDDSISNAKLANMAAYTLKGRNAGTTGDPSDIDITALTEKTTPASGDWLLLSDSAASGAFKKVDVDNLPGGGGGAPVDATYVTVSSNGTLTNETTLGALSNAIANTALTNMVNYTIKMRSSAGSGSPEDTSIHSLTEKSSPAAGDWLLLSDSAASGALKKVDIGNLPSGGGGGGNDDDSYATLLERLADIAGAAQFTYGDAITWFADSFDATTYVDTANSTNEDTGTAGEVKNTVSGGSNIFTGGSTIGDMTSNGGLAAAFDGVTSQASASSAAKITASNGYVGKTLASPSAVASATIYASNNNGYQASANPDITVTLYGKTGSAPANGTDGTSIGTLGPFTDTANESAGRDITMTDTTSVWDHVWAYIEKSGAAATFNCSELVALSPATGPNNLDLRSTAISVGPASVSTVTIWAIVNVLSGSVTLNTNLELYASRDGGTTFTEGTATELIATVDGYHLYKSEIDVSGQPAGNDVVLRLKTNTTSPEIALKGWGAKIV